MTTEQGLTVVVDAAPVTVFGTDDPAAIMSRVVAIAKPLGDFIRQTKMSITIGQNEYVKAEGWSFMGAMLGISPNTTRVDVIRDPEGGFIGFEAHVELRMKDGTVVGSAIAECTTGEARWATADTYAIKSMAQTRAAGKAFRMGLGFVMAAAGYEATPAEEMPHDAAPRRSAPRRQVVDVPSRDVDADAPAEFRNLGEFLTWALNVHKLNRADVAKRLNVANVSEITDFASSADELNGEVPF